MISQSGHGWLTTLADLSIILFMVTAADLSNAKVANEPAETTSAMIATAEPVAIFRPGGHLSLTDWLRQQPEDPRQGLTILVRYPPGEMPAVLDQGVQLAGEAEQASRPARVIVEESDRRELLALLAYDADPDAVARKLLRQQAKTNAENVK